MKIVYIDKKTNKTINLYGPLWTIKSVKCNVFLDDKLIIKESNTDDLSEEAKEYKYHEVEIIGGITNFYISSEYNNIKK